ncbi:MAG: hypothetical protein P8R37_10700 [Opitutae bacterium]|jgi:hypothetical protein|nr:hypothetical protein [Opitutae bacterium]
MKKYSIIIIFVLLLGLLGLQLLRQNEANSKFEIHEQNEDVSAEDTRETAQALTVGGAVEDQPSQDGEELKEAPIKTLWEDGNFPERLQIADLDMSLVFEGQVSEELKQVILADINLVLGHVKGHEFYNLPSQIPYKMPEQTEAYKANRGLIFNGLRVARPKEYRNNFGHVIEFGGKKNVVVSAELISAYEEAWEARKSKPRKYESLGSFITWLNTAPMEDLKANNPYWLFGYDGISDAYPERAAKMRESLLPKQRKDLQVSHPSILEFTYVDRKVLEEEGAAAEQLPVGVTLADGKYIDENGVPYQQALFLYDGEKWHIAFAPAGT